MMLEAQGDLIGAREKYLEALQAKPDFAEARGSNNLGNVLGFPALGEARYRTALQHNPLLAPALGNLGCIYYEKGDKNAAEELFLKALEQQPDLPDAWNHLGNLTRDKGEPTKAIEYYSRALALHPGHPYALNNMGNVLKDVGRRSEALQCYVAAVRALPASPVPHTNLGTLYKESGDLCSALLHYQEVLRLCPSSASSFCNIANLCKDASEALGIYSVALELDPSRAETHSNVANLLKDSGRLDEAIHHYSKALLLAESSDILRSGEVLSNLAHSLMFICDYSQRDVVLAQIEAMTRAELAKGQPPSVQPFHALVYPLPLPLITEISLAYGAFTERRVAGQIDQFKQVARPVTRHNTHIHAHYDIT